jgi:hypothetical protein
MACPDTVVSESCCSESVLDPELQAAKMVQLKASVVVNNRLFIA